MLLRLKDFIFNVGGELFTRGFWTGLVKRSLKAAVLSAVEGALKAIGLHFQATAATVAQANAEAAAPVATPPAPRLVQTLGPIDPEDFTKEPEEEDEEDEKESEKTAYSEDWRRPDWQPLTNAARNKY